MNRRPIERGQCRRTAAIDAAGREDKHHGHLRPGSDRVTAEATIEVTVSATAPLAPGKHRFQLVVGDDSGNQSEPAVTEVIVIDDKKPTAVLEAPARVSFGASFSLSGARSADLPPGKIVQYRWALIN